MAFTSIGSSVRPASMTKSTSSPVGRTPVEHLRAIEPDVPPREQVVQYEILEMGARRFAEACQMERESCIGPINFRGFDDAFRAIHGIGRQTYKLIRDFE